jgi:hypothetical protein
MTTSTTPITELEALNLILSVIGESPLASLDAVSASADAVLASQVLNEVNRSVQAHGWHFNVESGVTLHPEATTKQIVLPANCIRVDTDGVDHSIDIIQRGTTVYNKTGKTYQFTNPITVEMVTLLPYESLPQTARQYIAVRAARVFQSRAVGSDALFQFTARDEIEAYSELKRAEGITGDYNILSGSYSVARSLER